MPTHGTLAGVGIAAETDLRLEEEIRQAPRAGHGAVTCGRPEGAARQVVGQWRRME